MKHVVALIAASGTLLPMPALAWGFEGHQVVAKIARAELTPTVRGKVDALLAADANPLTGRDMADEATWADVYRVHGHRETAQWHFVDTELDHPSLDAACFGHPATDQPASAGPAQDCVVDKVQEFVAELSALGTAPAERLLALKYLLHFVGDLHQPLHASDNHDRGGNCVLLSLDGQRTQNLHAYWDTTVVEAFGTDLAQVAAQLRAAVTPGQRQRWQQGSPADWAQEAFQIARSTAYTLGSSPGCQQDSAPISPPPGYAERAQAAAAVQLERAGIRLGAMLNRALATVPITAASYAPSVSVTQPAAKLDSTSNQRSIASLACSAQADAKELHGKERQRFRRVCIRQQPTTSSQFTTPP